MKSQNEEIAEYLKQGNKITAIEALSKFQCFRLAGRISDLKKQGLNIQSDTVSNNGKRYSQYYLSNQQNGNTLQTS